MKHGYLRVLRATLLLTILLIASGARAATLKMATLAPERSPWGKVFGAWSRAVAKKTAGGVDVVWLYNGAAGPEDTVIGKIRAGQIAGGAVSATGLSVVHRPLIALQMPGVFAGWDELDRARKVLGPELDQALSAKGFIIGGWGDVGVARIFSRGYGAVLPGDLRGRRPAYARDSVIAPKVFAAIPGVHARPATAGEALGLLSTGTVDTVMAPSLLVEQLQWASRLTHLNTLPVGYGIGAVVLGEQAVASLSADERAVVLQSSRVAAGALTRSIRKADDEALRRLRSRLSVHEPTAAETSQWQALFRRTCIDVKRTLAAELLAKIGAC